MTHHNEISNLINWTLIHSIVFSQLLRFPFTDLAFSISYVLLLCQYGLDVSWLLCNDTILFALYRKKEQHFFLFKIEFLLRIQRVEPVTSDDMKSTRSSDNPFPFWAETIIQIATSRLELLFVMKNHITLNEWKSTKCSWYTYLGCGPN